MPAAPLRLVPKGAANANATEGRLEVFRNSTWGTFGGAFNHAAASVACRQMGKGTVGYAAAAAVYGSAGTGVPQWVASANCTGSEASLQDCAFAWCKPACSSGVGYGVSCGTCESPPYLGAAFSDAFPLALALLFKVPLA